MEGSTDKTAEDDSAQKYKNSVYRLEESIQKARETNDNLSRQLLFLRNRTNNVARKIGFATFEDFEEAVLDEPELWNMKAVRATYTQAITVTKMREQPRIHNPHQMSVSKRVMEVLEPLKYQGRSLQVPIEKACGRSEIESKGVNIRSPLATLKSVGNSSPMEASKLRAELNILSRKYDALVAAKESAEERYKKDYRKWKYFKSWIFNMSKHAKALRAQLAKGNFGDKFENDYDRDYQLAADLDQHSRSSRPRSDENISPQSQSFRHQATPQGKPDFTKREFTGNFKADARNHLSKSSRPFSSSSACRNPDAPHSEPGRLSIFAGVKEAPASPKSPSKSPQRKGRHASPAAAGEAINALYAIDTSRNNGLAFQYDEVVRNRKHRQRLDAGDCDCCKEYYEAVKALPDRLAPPAWLCSPTVDDAGSDNSGPSNLRDEVVSHKKQISRHRHQWSPAKTPPDYWNIGFPTTQEAADINRRAAEMHAAKRRRIEKEANMAGGRYIRRDEKREE